MPLKLPIWWLFCGKNFPTVKPLDAAFWSATLEPG